jgi:hypothetical protein
MTNLENFQNLYDTLINSSDLAWKDSQNPNLKNSSLSFAWQEKAAALEHAARLLNCHCVLGGIVLQTCDTQRAMDIEKMNYEEVHA